MDKIAIASFFALLVAGCGVSSSIPQPTKTYFIPTSTSIPTATASPSSTLIPLEVTAKQTINVRLGPGLGFKIAAAMPSKSTARVIGKSPDGLWLQITYPDERTLGWVSLSVVTISGSLDPLPIVALTPTSTPTAGITILIRTPALRSIPTSPLLPLVAPGYTPPPSSGST